MRSRDLLAASCAAAFVAGCATGSAPTASPYPARPPVAYGTPVTEAQVAQACARTRLAGPFEVAEALADLGWVAIEQSNDAKAPIHKATIVRQRSPQVAHADERDGPFAIHVKDAPELIAQVADIITCSSLAELAKIRQVFANLSRADAQSLAQLAR